MIISAASLRRACSNASLVAFKSPAAAAAAARRSCLYSTTALRCEKDEAGRTIPEMLTSDFTSNHSHTPLQNATDRIIYTETDEAPALATYSLYPVIRKFSAVARIDIVPCDISVSGRVLAAFPELLDERDGRYVPTDNLSLLGELCRSDPTTNIIKLPNISAPLNQLTECIDELRAKGYNVPLYPSEPSSDDEIDHKRRYDNLMGSAVNPVLREGNSDRRVAAAVKAYAQKNPHRLGIWSKASRTHVAHMDSGDFYGNEQSVIVRHPGSVKIEHVAADGTTTALHKSVAVADQEVIDASFLSVRKLREFYETEIADAKENELLLSLHLKATMMKVSDPILFGHCIEVYYAVAWQKHAETLQSVGVERADCGLSTIFDKLRTQLPADQAEAVIADFDACYDTQPWLAMVNSDKGITNLHAPNDVIIDASMPVVVRDSGKMWNRMGELEDTKCLIPDRCYATMYQEVFSYVKSHGQFDVATMGNVANVGLMAQKAEEYGSHDKTFKIKDKGKVLVTDNDTGEVYMEHKVEAGDVWRMCQTKDVAVEDWVKLAVNRARNSGDRTIFWLDKKRPHDANLMEKIHLYMKDHDTDGLDISILRPVDAVRVSMQRATEGKNTISVTGNVLRDYLTDLFPILELGTSAKMLSIVPLIKGGGLYETGAGGSAPKHVQQFVKEGHLRWDSLGEYLALAVCYEGLGENGNAKAKVLGDCLNTAVERILDNRKSPSRIVNQIDNRATNFYVALYWADALQQVDAKYEPIFAALSGKRAEIVEEFKSCQGTPVDLGGHYKFHGAKAHAAMNPSATLNGIMEDMAV